MKFIDDKNWDSFLDCIGPLLDTPEVQSMRALRHHPTTSCYGTRSLWPTPPSVWPGGGISTTGLLHDLYLYDSHDRSAYEGLQCFAHPKAALRNADALVGNLSQKEANSIISHMWPLARYMPKYREAYVVNLADKFCATAEVLGYWKRSRVKRLAMA